MVDLIICGTINALLFPIIALSFRTNSIYLPIYLSFVVVAFLIFGDLIIVIYHTFYTTDENLIFRPAYPTRTVLVCYIFLPLSRNSHAFVLGVTASLCYLASLFLITYRNDPDHVAKVKVFFLIQSAFKLYIKIKNLITD